MSKNEVSRSSFYPYPARPGMEMDRALDVLEADPEIELSESERERVISFERDLTRGPDGLESAWELSVKTAVFYPEYFATETGRDDLETTMGIVIDLDQGEDVEYISEQLYAHDYSSVSSDELAGLEGRSRSFVERRVVEQFAATDYASIDQVANPVRMTVIRNPGVLAEKVGKYRALKDRHRELALELSREDSAETQAKKVMLTIHRRRLNEMLAGIYPTAAKLITQNEIAPTQATTEAVGLIMKNLRLASDKSDDKDQRYWARLDRFRQGVGQRVEGSDHLPVNPEAQRLVDELADAPAQEVISDHVFQKVNPDHFETVKVTAEEWQAWARSALETYGLLSEHEEYSHDRSGRAPDDKWQVIIDPAAPHLSVNSKQGVMRVRANYHGLIASKYPAGAVPVLDHEIAHVIQHENKVRLGLAITEKVGMDRASVLAEGGALAWEAEAHERLFGQHRIVYGFYLRAVQAKLQGGSYRDCMKAYYDSCVAASGKSDTDRRRAAVVAANRTFRLFTMGGNFDVESEHITNTQPMAYLEQELVVRQLRERNQTSMLMIGGSNIAMLSELKRVDMLNTGNMFVPDKRPSKIVLDDIKRKMAE